MKKSLLKANVLDFANKLVQMALITKSMTSMSYGIYEIES